MRRVTLQTYESDGCWWARLQEYIHEPSPYPKLGGARVAFSGDTEEAARAKALAFVRAAIEALRTGAA